MRFHRPRHFEWVETANQGRSNLRGQSLLYLFVALSVKLVRHG
jgi:hypothetical protein